MKKLVYFSAILLIAALSACDESGSSSDNYSNDAGKGGSTARFAVCGNYLYTVNDYTMRVFNITNPSDPVAGANINIGFGIETIFPRGDSVLFVGSQIGMYIYDISTPGSPQKLSYFEHIRNCDPVVADDKYAYFTLHSSGSWCGRWTNELQIANIENLSNPYLVKSYPMYSPRGLGIDGKTLFLCDDGLKVYDVTDPMNIILKKHFHINATDVIPYDGLLLCIGSDGLYQYRYQNDTITFLSKIF
jgi:hypothetical protein